MSESMRDQFEEVSLAHFVAQRATGAQISGDNGCEPTREALFWRTSEGDYGVKMFNAAWWGWKSALAQPSPVNTAPPAIENVAKWFGPYTDGGVALNELRKACAEMLGYDVDTWPGHGNAPLAIGAALGLRDNKAKTADQLRHALNELVNRTAPICESAYGPGMDLAFEEARRVLGVL